MIICKSVVHIKVFLLPAISLKDCFGPPKKQVKNGSKSGKLASKWILKNFMKEIWVLMDQYGDL